MWRIKYALEKNGYNCNYDRYALEVTFNTDFGPHEELYFYGYEENVTEKEKIDTLVEKSKECYEKYNVDLYVWHDLCDLFSGEEHPQFNSTRQSLEYHSSVKENLGIIAYLIEEAVKQDGVMI